MKKEKYLNYLPFVLLSLTAISAVFIPLKGAFLDSQKAYNTADIAWMIVATALVFLMTPGLSLFYGGMVHRKNVLSTMMKSLIATGVVSVYWVFFGFSLCFGESIGGFIGNPFTFLFFDNVLNGSPWVLAPTIPLVLFAVYQLMFAIITPGLVVGAVAERIRFRSYTLFIVMFSIFVYAPLAHWTWHPEGFLFKWGVLDFAGGTVVHISAGCAALAGALVLKSRIRHRLQETVPPANIPYILIGTGLLWFGWFGFNAGSAFGVNAITISALVTTNTAGAAAGLAWMYLDVVKGKKPSVSGFCIGAVVGLVAITPGAGFVGIPQSIFIGFIASIISNYAVHYKERMSLDDALDVFPCHGIGGIVGMFLTGIFANKIVNVAGNDGLLYGNFSFFFTQVKALVIVVAYSFIMSWLIFKLINIIVPLRVSEIEEEEGLDTSQHGEKYTRNPHAKN